MTTAGTFLRDATVEDAQAIVDIYNYEVLNGKSNYETRPRSLRDQQEWLTKLLGQEMPVLVVCRSTKVVGFGALTPFHSVSGYRFTCSGVIYVSKNERGAGVGQKLVRGVQAAAHQKGIRTLLAGINSENIACLKLLRQMGFVEAGYFKEIGFKNGEWLDDVCMQWKVKNPHDEGN